MRTLEAAVKGAGYRKSAELMIDFEIVNGTSDSLFF
jgi:hypothetical protein